MARRRRFNIEEYSALKTAYGKPYGRKDLIISLLKPFLFIATYTYLLYYYWWLSIIYGLLAAYYQFRRINKLNFAREFAESAFNERNKFINNLTQILTNENTTTLDGLIDVKDRTSGEFRQNLTVLLTRLRNASPSRVHDAIESFKSNYETDIIFMQYMDQIESAILDGRTNIEVLKDIRSFHNSVKEKRDYFIRRKAKRGSEFFKIVLMLLGSVLTITFSLGFKKYVNGFAHTPIGWVSLTLYLLCIFLVFRSHLKKQEDDEVMEIDM